MIKKLRPYCGALIGFTVGVAVCNLVPNLVMLWTGRLSVIAVCVLAGAIGSFLVIERFTKKGL